MQDAAAMPLAPLKERSKLIVKITAMEKRHLRSVQKLGRDILNRDIDNRIFDPLKFAFVAEKNNEVVGFSVGRIDTSADFFNKYPQVRDCQVLQNRYLGVMQSSAVREDCRRSGLGMRLFKARLDILDKLHINLVSVVWQKNNKNPAEHMACRYGFKRIMEIPNCWKKHNAFLTGDCPECKKNPCSCSGILLVREYEDSNMW